jgi:hypothetical protein
MAVAGARSLPVRKRVLRRTVVGRHDIFPVEGGEERHDNSVETRRRSLGDPGSTGGATGGRAHAHPAAAARGADAHLQCMGSMDAPRGSIPVLGETWRPVGRNAFVVASWLAPIDLVRPLVPPELEIAPVLPGRTAATLFLGDYGPGSTLEYHELGVNPALVFVRGLPAVWNQLLVVDSEAARIGGALVGAHKEVLPFAWEERRENGRVSGTCSVGAEEESPFARIEYRQGLLPVPTLPMRAATLRDELLLVSRQRIRGSHRLSHVRVEVDPDGPLGWMRALGPPLVSVVTTRMRGRLMEAPRVARILAHRAVRPEVPDEQRPFLH